MNRPLASPLVALAVLLLGGCPKATVRPPPPTPGHPVVDIPAGCERDLGGTWAHADDPTWQYRGTDDGGTLLLDVQRLLPDAGAPSASGAVLELHRTADGFVGVTRAEASTPEGDACTVEFPTEITACGDERLTLKTAERVSVDAASCQRAAESAPAETIEHRLDRIAPPPPPGGNDVAGLDGGPPPLRPSPPAG